MWYIIGAYIALYFVTSFIVTGKLEKDVARILNSEYIIEPPTEEFPVLYDAFCEIHRMCVKDKIAYVMEIIGPTLLYPIYIPVTYESSVYNGVKLEIRALKRKGYKVTKR